MHPATVGGSQNEQDARMQHMEGQIANQGQYISELSTRIGQTAASVATLDAKLATALHNAIRNNADIQATVNLAEEESVALGARFKGRQILKIICQKHETHERVGQVYNIQDLMAVRLRGQSLNDLKRFQRLWRKINLRVRNAVDEQTKQMLYWMQLEHCTLMKDDINLYRRALSKGDHDVACRKYLVRSPSRNGVSQD